MTDKEKEMFEKEEEARSINYLLQMIEKYGPTILNENSDKDA